MSKRTQEKKGQSLGKKLATYKATGNFWVPTITRSAAGKIYKSVKPVQFTPMSPMDAAMAKVLRQQKQLHNEKS